MSSSPPSPVTYIPPLRDGACGTTPRSQQPLWPVVRQEMAQMLRMMPTLCWALLVQQQQRRPRAPMSSSSSWWADTAGMMLHVVLACLEMGMMLTAVPLWFVLPGAVFAAWVCVCAAAVTAMCWMLNGKGQQMHQCNAGSEGWMMGQEEAEDEKWMFLGGMGMSARHCHKQTLPALSRLFSRPMVCICMRTYGMPFDMMAMMMQRCMPMPSQARRNLYSQMRCALLDDSMNRCVILCHNDGAVLVSQAVTQLCADLPSDKLRKLEIYTFGAAAYEFVMPLGDANMESDPAHQSGDQASERRGIHVEHFAMASDPFAQMGVLQSVRQNMDSRFCGGVFIMNDNNATRQMCFGLTMEQYLMALFPAQVMPCSTATSSAGRSVLDSVMTIDRDCAEKREIAAMSNYHAASQTKKGGGKRLSWTGLATMAGQRNGMNAGMVALEMARKGCKNCDGHKGREVSWLVRYVVMEGKQAADGMNGGRSP
ncbi:hypothetical protein C8A00DRAFT_17866 [Chaetomidium leptoderma]|uniref:Uncharacterized protein n=1 Tax=Chaetomidium leptoderma TaxID=669021 RepID=A0AAN6VHJ4_9PEZI|nr:hypothetical protein C8A00DRAFT_17866 [Chaetomidium leptoderma]